MSRPKGQNMLTEILIAIFLIIPFFIGIALSIAAILASMRENREWGQARRYNYKYRYSSDYIGNKDSFFDPETGIFYEPAPGNKAFADPAPQIAVLPDGRSRIIKQKEEEIRVIPVYSNGNRPTETEPNEEPPIPPTLPAPRPKSELELTVDAYQNGHTTPIANGHACGWKESKARGLIKLAKEQGLIQ
jgi:hypothetical protein